MIQPPARIHTASRELNAAQDNIIRVIKRMLLHRPIDSVTVSSVTISSTADTKVAHGLGKQPSGWIVTDIDTLATVKRVSWDKSFLVLRASANAKVSLIVY